jgi:ribosomal protein L23
MSYVKESVEEIFKNKERKVASTFNVENEELKAFDFKNLQLSDSKSYVEDKCHKGHGVELSLWNNSIS